MGKMLRKYISSLVNGEGIFYLLRILQYPLNKIWFKEWHKSSYIKNPILISGRKNISVGANVIIMNNARIEAVKKYNDVLFHPNIIFKKRVSIQQGVHLTCADSIIIGENTAIAAYVTITDINHPYDDIFKPIEHQDIEVRPVVIGKDSKIYNGAVILPGVNIGNHVTVGANSVVTKDIPDYCVAVGAPAYIVKRYNFEKKKWMKTDKHGKFL